MEVVDSEDISAIMSRVNFSIKDFISGLDSKLSKIPFISSRSLEPGYTDGDEAFEDSNVDPMLMVFVEEEEERIGETTGTFKEEGGVPVFVIVFLQVLVLLREELISEAFVVSKDMESFRALEVE